MNKMNRSLLFLVMVVALVHEVIADCNPVCKAVMLEKDNPFKLNTCARMFSGPNTCPPGTAVTAATAGLNVTGLPPNYCSNPTITTCLDATKPDIPLDCTSCGLKTPAMESFCCKAMTPASGKCAPTGPAGRKTGSCCTRYNWKCSDPDPNRYGTPFSLNSGSVELLDADGVGQGVGIEAHCPRLALGCPPNYVAHSIGTGIPYQNFYFCIDPACEEVDALDCSKCSKCPLRFSNISDKSCQPNPSLNVFITANVSNIYEVPETVTRTFQSAVYELPVGTLITTSSPLVPTLDLSTDYNAAMATVWMYPIFDVDLRSAKEAFSPYFVDVQSRRCEVNSTLKDNSALPTLYVGGNLQQLTGDAWFASGTRGLILPGAKDLITSANSQPFENLGSVAANSIITGFVPFNLYIGAFEVTCKTTNMNNQTTLNKIKIKVADRQAPWVYLYDRHIRTVPIPKITSDMPIDALSGVTDDVPTPDRPIPTGKSYAYWNWPRTLQTNEVYDNVMVSFTACVRQDQAADQNRFEWRADKQPYVIQCYATDVYQNVGGYNPSLNVSSSRRGRTGIYVYVFDDESPIIICPIREKINTTLNSCGARLPDGYKVKNYDNVGIASLSCVPALSSVFGHGSTTIYCFSWDTAKNPWGSGPNYAGCSFVVEVVDVQPPAMDCSQITLVANASLIASTEEYMYPLDRTRDNCFRDVTTICTVNGSSPYGGYPEILRDSGRRTSGYTFPLGKTTTQCTSTDWYQNSMSCPIVVNVVDRTPPVMQCPPAFLVTLPNRSYATLTGNVPVSATDNDGTNPIITCTPNSGNFNVTLNLGLTGGSHPVTDPLKLSPIAMMKHPIVCKATDLAGNFATCNINLTVTDIEVPTVQCQNPVVYRYLRNPGNDGKTIQGPGTFCNGTATSPTCFFVINYTTPTGQDNVKLALKYFTATYFSGKETPFSSPPGPDGLGVTVSLPLTSGSRTVFIGDKLNKDDSNPIIKFEYKVIDTSGLFSSCSFTVNIIDGGEPDEYISPIIHNCPSRVFNFTKNQTLLGTNKMPESISYYIGKPEFFVYRANTSQTSKDAIINLTKALKATDLESNFTITYYQTWGRAPIVNPITSQNYFNLDVGVYIADFSAMDRQGNTADCVFLLNISDFVPPKQENCPGDQGELTISNISKGVNFSFWPETGISFFDYVGIDNPYGTCTSAPPNNCPPFGTRPDRTFPPGYYNFTITAKDNANNVALPCKFSVSVKDITQPVIKGCLVNLVPYSKTLVANEFGFASLIGSCPAFNATDNVDDFIDLSFTQRSQNPIGGPATGLWAGYNCSSPDVPVFPTESTSAMSMLFKVTDRSGNMDSCPTLFVIKDETKPVLKGCDSDNLTTYEYTTLPGQNFAIVSLAAVMATDAGVITKAEWSNRLTDFVKQRPFSFVNISTSSNLTYKLTLVARTGPSNGNDDGYNGLAIINMDFRAEDGWRNYQQCFFYNHGEGHGSSCRHV